MLLSTFKIFVVCLKKLPATHKAETFDESRKNKRKETVMSSKHEGSLQFKPLWEGELL